MNQYEAPTLNDEDIGTALQAGLLGEQISHVTIEQLKSSSSALVLQLCIGILQKLDVDTDHLGQNFLQPDLKSVEHYQSTTFYAVHVPRYFHHLVPGCSPKQFCTADLLRPKWNRLKKFLSIVINYCRFLQSNQEVFQKVNAKSEELHQKVEEDEEQNKKVRAALKEVDEYMVRNAALHQEQILEKAEAEKELQDVLTQKENKHNCKADIKKSVENLKNMLDDRSVQYNCLMEKVEDMKKMVVTSPQKQISELSELKQKLDVVNDDVANVQDQIQTQQWNIEKQEGIIKHLEFALKQVTKFQELYDKFRTIKAGLLREKFQTDEDKMNLACIRQEIDNLKQLKIDERDQIHRTKLRGQNKFANQKQHLQDLNKQAEKLISQAQDKGQQIKSLILAIQEEESLQIKLKESQSREMAQLEMVKIELTNAIELTYTNANKHIKQLVAARSAAFKSFLNS